MAGYATKIYTFTAIINTVAAFIEQVDEVGTVRLLFTEARPMTLAEADTYLAFHSLGRVAQWDLHKDGLSALVRKVDNRFNGTVAARLNKAVGTTHEEYKLALAKEAQDGDLISDTELSNDYVVAGSRREGSAMRIHMVSEGKTWEDRYTTDFPADQPVMIARRKA